MTISKRPGLQTGVKNDIFGLKKGQDLKNRAAHPPSRIYYQEYYQFISNCQNFLADPSRETRALGGL